MGYADALTTPGGSTEISLGSSSRVGDHDMQGVESTPTRESGLRVNLECYSRDLQLLGNLGKTIWSTMIGGQNVQDNRYGSLSVRVSRQADNQGSRRSAAAWDSL